MTNNIAEIPTKHKRWTGGPSRPLFERYSEKVDVRGTDECWPWLAGLDTHGYGAISSGTTKILAHQLALIYAGIPRPNDDHALHSCDNRKCQNPKHLRWGTNAENNADMMSKGRNKQPQGSAHKHAKLTENDVLAIRSDTRTLVRIASDYGVRHVTISAIKLRKSWKHVA